MKKYKSIVRFMLVGIFVGCIPFTGFAAGTPSGTLPYTGDHSRLGLVAAIMGVALIVIIAVVISMKKKK